MHNKHQLLRMAAVRQVVLHVGDRSSGETVESQTRRWQLGAGGGAREVCPREAGPGQGSKRHSTSAEGRDSEPKKGGEGGAGRRAPHRSPAQGSGIGAE